jgi:ABC-2 type transport system permease protein
VSAVTSATTAAPTVDTTSPTAAGDAIAAVRSHALRSSWKGAVAIGLTAGVVAASSALAYAGTYPTVASRRAVAAGVRSSPGLSTLFGSLARIESVGGYTAYKSYVFMTTIAAIWAALATTRILRGEEETGRWQLILAGRTRPATATRAAIAGIAIAITGAMAITIVALLAAGRRRTLGFDAIGCAAFGAATLLPAYVFSTLAAVASQLASTRRLATGLSMAALGTAFVLRMIGDSGHSRSWVLWTTPLGWAELVHPLTTNDALPVVVAALTTIALATLAVVVAPRRDVGAGVIATKDSSALRPRGLGSTSGLAARLNRGMVLGWAAGVTATAFVYGTVARAAKEMTDTKGAADTLSKLGSSGTGTNQYLGVTFLLTGAVLALVPAGHISAARDEESSGRIVHLLAGPTGRARWFVERLFLASVAVVGIGLAAGIATWAGAASQGVDVRIWPLVGAGANIVPTALVSLGVGALAFAAAPRVAPMAVYLTVGWSLIVDLLGSLVTGLAWLRRLSLLHYMALVPAQRASPTNLVLTSALAIALAVSAVAVFTARDLHLD